MLKKQLLFLFFFSFISCFGQDSTHVSAFLKDEYKVFELENNLDQDLSNYYLTTPYIQNADGVVNKNENYDAYTDSLEINETSENYLKKEIIIKRVNRQINFGYNIPPVLSNLKDGKYIQYFAPLAYLEKDTIKFIRNKIAAIFYIKNNNINGPAYWFLFDQQKVYKTGNYKDGIREGKWTMKIETVEEEYKIQRKGYKTHRTKEISTNVLYTIETHYVNGLKEGNQIKTNIIFYKTLLIQKEEIHFVNNLEEDKYLYTENDIPMVTGIYKKGEEVGDWYFYDWFDAKKDRQANQKINLEILDEELSPLNYSSFQGNNKAKVYQIANRVLIEHYKINEEKTPGKSVVIRGEMRGYHRNYKWNSNQYKMDDYFNKKERSRFTMSYDEFFSIPRGLNYFNNGIRINRQKEIDSFGYVFDYLEYEHYYSNGQLFTKFKLENGNLLMEDTIFWSNGNIMESIEYDASKKEYIQKEFEENGDLTITMTFDDHGRNLTSLSTHQNETLEKDGIIYEHHFSEEELEHYYTFENKDSIPLLDKDSTINIHGEFILPYLKTGKIKDKDIRHGKKITYNPGTRTVVIIEKSEEIIDVIITKLQYDPSFLTYKKTVITVIGELTISNESFSPVSDYDINLMTTTLQKNTYINELTYFENKQIKNSESITFYKGQPFTGKLEVLFSNKIKEPKLKDHLLTIYLKDSKSILNFFGNSYPLLASYAKPLKLWEGAETKKSKKNTSLITTFLGEFENGKLHGTCKFINGDQKIMTQIPFLNNLQNGTILINYEKKRSENINNQYYLGAIENYLGGVENGAFLHINEIGDTLLNSYYINGQLTGKYFSKRESVEGIKIKTAFYQYGLSSGKMQVFDTTGVLLENILYKDEKPQGLCSFYDGKGNLFQTAYFDKGEINDTVFTYNIDKSIRTKSIYRKNVFLKELDYENGILIKEFTNDTLEVKITKPLESYKSSMSSLFENYYPENYNRSKTNSSTSLSGYIKYYNTEGEVIAEGHVSGEVNSITKRKLWKYNYPIPNGKYTINYEYSTIKINDTPLFQSKGEYLQKDENENLISRKYIISEEKLYNCGANETYEVLLYYIDFEKDSSLHLKNGFIKNYYTTGVKQSEGNNINGLPNGLWKFYNDNGSLREMGHYINGNKQGRWLSGDLSKVHYMGDVCLEIDSKKMELFVENLESKLIIQETFFKNGIKTSTNSFVLSK